MDKSWVHMHQCSKEYDDGVKAFVDYAFAHGFKCGGKVKCPCKNCKNMNLVEKETLYEHLVCDGMMRNYKVWHLHGEKFETTLNVETIIENNNGEGDGDGDGGGNGGTGDDIIGMLHDGFRIPNMNGAPDGTSGGIPDDVASETNDIPNNGDAAQFYKLMKESEEPLYPGCKNYTKLSFLFKLWHLKCLGGISNSIFSSLLHLLRKAFPEGCTLPENFTQSKKIIIDMGLGYNKIDACPNDCMLFWKENSKLEKCLKCGASRYVKESGITKKKTPAKILRHFPLKPRLQRLYMSSKTATDMRWHHDGRTKDGVMRHFADSKASKHFDNMHPGFAAEPRNVRLGLASDGFNPFGNMSSVHSTWPVVLIPYNLPPWLCMKQSHMILSLLISGPKSPGNNIDTYLRPLIDELKELWEEGVDTYDASKKKMFKMYAAVLCTISDFPGLAMLSGWSTKGYLACPSCHQYTCSKYLNNGRKQCYMGHRRFLPMDHKFRRMRKQFNGDIEEREAPTPLTGREILEQLKHVENTIGHVSQEDGSSRRKRARVIERPGKWKKDQKGDLKLMYFKPLNTPEYTTEERLANCPPNVIEDQWEVLVRYWEDPDVDIEEDPNRDAPQGKPTTRMEVFKKVHTKKDKTPTCDLAKNRMDQMNEKMDEAIENGLDIYSIGPGNIYSKVMGPDTRGRRRCFGRGTFPGESSNNNSKRDNIEVTTLKRKVVDVEEELQSTKQQYSDLKNTTTQLQTELTQLKALIQLFLANGNPLLPTQTQGGFTTTSPSSGNLQPTQVQRGSSSSSPNTTKD